jgi:hypothetical protein
LGGLVELEIAPFCLLDATESMGGLDFGRDKRLRFCFYIFREETKKAAADWDGQMTLGLDGGSSSRFDALTWYLGGGAVLFLWLLFHFII